VIAPGIVARTVRQILRETVPDDAPAMFALNADPEVRRYTGDAPFASVEEARSFLAAYDAYAREGMGRWAAVEVATGEVLGWCGLRRQRDGDVDLGYRYKRGVWGQGLATEASAACLDLAFGALALNTVVARTHPENARSIRVLEKLGFRLEGPSSFDGLPAVLYRLRAIEWRKAT
jgi:[ribosomal protein S5]-alanine N-acetyltransferase